MDELNPHVLAERWSELLPEALRVAKGANALKSVASKLSTREGYEALKKLQGQLAKLAELSPDPGDVLERARALGRDVDKWLETEWDRRAREFAADSRAYFASRGVELEGEGVALHGTPFDVIVEPQQDRAMITYAAEPVKEKIPLACERLYAEWLKAQALLVRQETPPQVLGPALFDAYLASVDAVGKRVKLPRLHFQLFVQRQTAKVKQDPRKGNVKEYPRYQFAWDLAQLLAEPDRLRRDGQVLELIEASESAARSRATSITVLHPERGAVSYSDAQAVD